MTKIFDLVVLALAESYKYDIELKVAIYFLLFLIWVVGVANAADSMLRISLRFLR